MTLRRWFIVLFTLYFRYNRIQGGEYCRSKGTDSLYCRDEIPKKVNNRTTRMVVEFTKTHGSINITENSFMDNSYQHITSMEIRCEVVDYGFTLGFDAGCFTGLDNLAFLKITVRRPLLFQNSFFGLPSVTELVINNCDRMQPDQFISAFASNTSLLNLEMLAIQKSFVDAALGIDLTSTFLKAVSDRPIRNLTLSGSEINILDVFSFMKHCNKLHTISLSQSTISEINGTLMRRVCKNLKVLDLSYPKWPTKTIPAICVSIGRHRDVTNISFSPDKFAFAANVETFIADEMCPIFEKNPINIINITHIHFDTKQTWHIKEIIIRRTRLQIIDAGFDCKQPYTGLKKIVLSYNLIEFLSPDLITCVPCIEYLDIGNNFLYKMSRDNSSLFETILWSLKLLRYIDLSGNKLRVIPTNTFSKNSKLEHIDLSNNCLSIINFSISSSNNLRVLNLSSNLFSTIDVSSRAKLQHWMSASFDWILDLTDNSLSCTHCDDIGLLEWAVTHSNVFFRDLSCIDINHQKIDMLKEESVLKFKKRCNIPAVVVICVLTFSALFTLVGIMVFVMIKEKKAYEQIRTLKGIYRDIVKYDEYVVFIYCEDEHLSFVTKSIYVPLQEKFAKELETTKQVVAIGKGPENAGFSIIKEIVALSNMSYVVLIVLTKSFVESRFCVTIFEAFVQDNKPLVLVTFDDESNELKDTIPDEMQLFVNKHETVTFRRQFCSSENFETFQSCVFTAIQNRLKTCNKQAYY